MIKSDQWEAIKQLAGRLSTEEKERYYNKSELTPLLLRGLKERGDYHQALDLLKQHESFLSERVKESRLDEWWLDLVIELPESQKTIELVEKVLDKHKDSLEAISKIRDICVNQGIPAHIAIRAIDRWAELKGASVEEILQCKRRLFDHYLGGKQKKDILQLITSVRKESATEAAQYAMDMLNSTRDIFDEDADIILSCGDFYLETQQDINAAYKEYRRLRKVDPSNEKLRDRFEKILHRYNNQTDPKKDIEIEVHYQLARIVYEEGDLLEAKTYLDKVLPEAELLAKRAGGKTATISVKLDASEDVGRLLINIQNLTHDVLEKLLMENQGDNDLRWQLAEIKFKQGLWVGAAKEYRKIADNLKKDKKQLIQRIRADERFFSCYILQGRKFIPAGLRYLAAEYKNLPNIELQEMTGEEQDINADLIESYAVGMHHIGLNSSLLSAQDKENMLNQSLALYGKLVDAGFPMFRPHIQELWQDLQTKREIHYPTSLVPRLNIKKFHIASDEIGSNPIEDDGIPRNYTQVKLIAEDSAFGEIFLYEDTAKGRLVAIKRLKRRIPNFREAEKRFNREKDILMQLKHENIVQLYDAGVTEGRQFLIMDYVESGDMERIIRNERESIKPAQLVEMFVKICNGVNYIHTHEVELDDGRKDRVLHRDLHPRNILIGKKDYSTVKITDFGLATVMDRDGTTKSTRLNGAEKYVAPEVQNRQPDTIRSEIYSLGRIFNFMLTGYAGSRKEDFKGEIEPFYPIVSKATMRNPDDRYESVFELIKELCDVIHSYLPEALPICEQIELGGPFSDIERFEAIFGDQDVLYENADTRTKITKAEVLDGPKQGKIMAIKRIGLDTADRQNIVMSNIYNLQHDYIVRVYFGHCFNEEHVIVREHIDGCSLDALITLHRQAARIFPLGVALQIVSHLTKALAYSHQLNIVHCCVKPTNILLDLDHEMTKLSDFGMTGIRGVNELCKSTRLLKHEDYMAPEISQGKDYDDRSDIYSLGILLLEMLTGETIVDQGSLAAIAANYSKELEDKKVKVLQNLIRKASEPQPSKREPPNAEAFGEILKGFRTKTTALSWRSVYEKVVKNGERQ